MSSSYCQDNIKLEEAMTMELTHETRVWSVLGLHIEVKDITPNFTVEKTFVLKSNGKQGIVGISGTIKAEKETHHMNGIVPFSGLEELQKKCPQLFELEGNLLAFS